MIIVTSPGSNLGEDVAELRRRFDIAFLYTRPLSPSIYLHCGPGALGAAVVPLDALPWTPTQTPKIARSFQ
jgi:fatty acid-binding protein DegV